MKCYCTKEMVKHDTGDYVCSDPKCRWIWDKDETPPFHMKYPWWIQDRSPLIWNALLSRGSRWIPKETYEKYLAIAEKALQPKPDPLCQTCGKVMGPFIQRTAHGRDGFCNYGCSFDQEHSLGLSEDHVVSEPTLYYDSHGIEQDEFKSEAEKAKDEKLIEKVDKMVGQIKDWKSKKDLAKAEAHKGEVIE